MWQSPPRSKQGSQRSGLRSKKPLTEVERLRQEMEEMKEIQKKQLKELLEAKAELKVTTF